MALSISADLRASLSDRYDLLREVGRGGMATVYLAQDKKHDREVAVKVLRPDLAATLGVERFLREIEIAARLQHPHVLMLIDSGQANDVLYYVMPYVDGGSLRERLLRDRRVDVDTTIDIISRVADAVEYAHRQGIVHRDIKPENVLFSQGHPVVADFGIAKAVTQAGPDNLTRTGFPVGTPGYMSPEQAIGHTDLDERTDVYAITAVCYEMLVGEPPASWVTDESVRVLRFADVPDDHRQRLDRLSGTIEQALVRGLALRVEDRCPTPANFVRALQGRDDHRYRETEVKNILQRASDLEASSPTVPGAMSLGGVERIGAEVGIAPVHVRRAAKAVAPRPTVPVATSAWAPVLGSEPVIRIERIVDGEIAEVDHPFVAEEIRAGLGLIGSVDSLGNALTWHATGSSGSGRDLHVMVAARGGRTRIRIEERLANLIGGLFGGVVGGGGSAAAALSGSLLAEAGLVIPAIAVVGGALGGAYLIARGFYRRSWRSRRQQLEALADRLAELVVESGR